MDKIAQLHYNEIGAGYIPEESEKSAAIHATITEDLMGKAMEWARKSGYRITDDGLYWYKKGVKIGDGQQVWFIESELIQLFKETL